MAVPVPRRGRVIVWTAFLAAVSAAGAPPAQAAARNGYGNVVNVKFATVANGPLGALIVDVPAGASAAAARTAVAARVAAECASCENALAVQGELLRQYPPYPGGVAPVAPAAFDGVVMIRSRGALVTPSSAGEVRIAALGSGELAFTLEGGGWTAAEKQKLSTFLGYAYPAVRAVYGAPATSGTIKIVRSTNVPAASRNGGGYFNASLNEIHLYPSGGFPQDAEEVNLNLLHLIVHAFHGTAQLRYDAWEEGFARAATLAALEVLDPAAEAPKPGGSIVRYTDYHLIQLYDLLNQPALGNDRFLSDSGWDGMLLWRNAMATAAWLKVYAEDRDFFKRFNAAYYASYTPELAGNVPALVSLVAGLLPGGVEGLPFADWYRRQHVLDTSVTPGTKLFVYNAPVFPTQNRPPSLVGWSQVAILHYFRTESTDGRTWKERPLSGTAYPVAWSWEYGKELPLEAQDQRVVIQNGVGATSPTFFNIGSPTAQRVAIDYAIGGESVRTYLPVTYTGVDPSWNDLFGVLVGGDGGIVRAELDGVGAQDLPVTQGGFGARLAGGALSQISRLTLTSSDGASVVTRRVNTGYDFYVALLPVGDSAPRRITRTISAGLRMLSMPATPLRFDPAGDLGLSPATLALARWNPSLAIASKYEAFPLAPPFRPGRGFWVKLPADRTLQVDAVLPDPGAPVAISAPAGWNQIASPWQASLPVARLRVKYQEREMVSFASAVQNGWIATKVWRWAPGAGPQITDTLDAWDAAWIKVNVADGVTLIAPPVTAATAALGNDSLRLSRVAANPSPAPGAQSRLTWRLRIEAAVDDGVSEVTIGAAPGASDGFDPGLDEERPPSGGGEGSLPVLLRVLPVARGWSRTPALDLDTDVRRSGAAHERWVLEVRTARPGATVQLSLSTEGDLPRGLRLRDLRTGRRLPLAPGSLTLPGSPDGTARWAIER
jgi:hypothetical protein